MSDFSKSLLKIIIAQIAKDSGFDGISSSACSVLIDVAERYLQLLGELTLEKCLLRDSIEISIFDAILALEEMAISSKSLSNYWDKWGIRIPTNKLQAHKERGAATAGSGNAIIEAILGIRKSVVEEEKMALPKEISGFFRMEPGQFPLGTCYYLSLRFIDVDRFLGSDYAPETIQKVPDETEAMILERKEEEIEEESSQKKLFLYPSQFSDSVYYQGTISEYVGHVFKQVEGGKSRGKAQSKIRKLFSRAYRSCLDSDSDTFHVDPSMSLMTLQCLQKACLDRIRYSTVIPEASISGFGLGLLEEIHTYYLPDLNGCKRALPQYKDDKKALRKELRALEAAKLEPSTSDYPIRFHQDIINTYAEMTQDSKADMKSEDQEDVKMEISQSQVHFTTPVLVAQKSLTSSAQIQSTSESVSIKTQNSQSSIAAPFTLNIPKDKPVSSPAKIKLKIKKETSSPLKITISRPSQDSKKPVEAINPISEPSIKTLGNAPVSNVKSENGPPALASPESQIKCICQHSTVDFGRFMIACDRCEIWFHGECVKVGPDTIQTGAQWLCLRCSVD